MEAPRGVTTGFGESLGNEAGPKMFQKVMPERQTWHPGQRRQQGQGREYPLHRAARAEIPVQSQRQRQTHLATEHRREAQGQKSTCKLGRGQEIRSRKRALLRKAV